MKNVIRSIVSIILSVFIFLSAFAAIASAIIKFRLVNVEHYVDYVVDDNYVNALYDDVKYNVGVVCENLEVDKETVMTYVDKSELKELSKENFRILFNSVLEGADLSYLNYDNPSMKDEIYLELEEFANEMGIVDEDLTYATDVTYDYIVDRINRTLTYFTQENVDMVSFVSQIQILDFVINNAFYITIAALVVLCVIMILLHGKKRIFRTLYKIAFTSWLASACWFFPVLVAKVIDISSGIILAHGGFKLYIQNLINVVIDGFFVVSLWAFVTSAALVILMIVLVLVHVAKCNKKTSIDEQAEVENIESEQNT